MSDEKLPSMGTGKGKASAGGARAGAGRPTNKQLDERAAGLDMREGELSEREAELAEREAALQQAEQAAVAPTRPPRVSMDEGAAPKEFSAAAENSRSARSPLEMGKKFPDVTPYQQRHQDMQLMWVNDESGDVQRWIDLGAEPVPLIQNESRSFEGITDRQESKWVRVIGGETKAGAFYVYLLMIEPDEYERIKIAPIRARQELIKRAMKAGGNRSGEETPAGMPTYAPNLPSGQQGYQDERQHIAGPDAG